MNKVYEIRKPGKSWIDINQSSLTIKRKGMLNSINHGFKGEKTIPLKSISAVQLKKATFMTSGYIQFTLVGGNESTGGLFAATKDENTVMFVKKYNEKMLELKAYIDKYISEPNQYSQSNSLSPIQQIKELKELLDEEIITRAEFEAKKQQLLDL